jgi:hypothetical protein
LGWKVSKTLRVSEEPVREPFREQLEPSVLDLDLMPDLLGKKISN